MSMLRFDHVGVVVDDLDAATAFFVGLGFEREGGTTVEGEAVDKIKGLAGVRAEGMMVRTPDGTGKLELVRYHAPADDEGLQPWPANRPGFRHICIEVEDLNAIVDRLRDDGFDTEPRTASTKTSIRPMIIAGRVPPLRFRICLRSGLLA